MVTADIYCRLSLAQMGDTTKVDDQERICRDLVTARGWQVGEVWKDNSRSAWQRTRRRPGWEAMLERVDQGAIDAIVVYHGDRLIRQPYDLEKLLNLAASRGVRLAAPGGTRDLSNPDDQFVLRIEAAMACRESDNISRRTKAGHERRRRRGIVRAGGRGGRAFGFATDGVTHMPAEAAIVRDIAGRILAGQGAGQICHDLNDRDLPTVTGGRWQHGTIRKMMARPRYAGLLPDGRPAAWEPILDRETWEQVCGILAARAKGFLYVTNERRYLLSGIATCGTCGQPVAIRHNVRPELLGYGCINPACAKRVHRKAEHADEYVMGYVAGLLRLPGFAAELASSGNEPDVTAQILHLERLREQARAQLESLSDMPPSVIAAAARGMAGYEEKIARLRDRMIVVPGLRLAQQHAGLSPEEFQALPLGTRRIMIAAMVSVEILPTGRRGPGFDPDSIRIRPRKDAEQA